MDSTNKISFLGKIIIGLVVLFFLFLFYVALDANKYSAQVMVIEGEGRVGVNPTTESLDFGDLSRGSSAVRRVEIANGTRVPMKVIVWELGGISDLMNVSENNFTLQGGETKRLEFTTYIPASAVIEKIYIGRVFIFKIPTFGLF